MGILALKLLYSIIIFIAIAESSPAPQRLKECEPLTSNADECNRRLMQAVTDNARSGYEDLRITPFDPLYVPILELTEGYGATKFRVQVTDGQVTGLSDMHVTSFKMSPSEQSFEKTGIVPKLTLVGNYSMTGNIDGKPTNGRGEVNITMVNATISVMYRGNLTRKGCHLYLNVNHFTFQVQPEKMISFYTNLIEGNEALAQSTLNMINQFDLEIFAVLAPKINAELSRIVRPIIQEFHDKVAYDDMFTEFKVPCHEDRPYHIDVSRHLF